MRKLMASLVALVATAAAANAGVIYTSSVAFNAANPGLSVITFEAIAPPGGFVEPVAQPIAAGVTFTNPVNGQASIAVSDSAFFFATPTDVLFVDLFNTPLDINFSPTVGAAGFNVANGFGGGPITLDIFNGATLLGTTTINVANQTVFTGFLGFDGFGPVTRVRITPNNGGFVLIDNLQFGQAAAIPEPISLLVFGGLVVSGGLVARKRLLAKKVVA